MFFRVLEERSSRRVHRSLGSLVVFDLSEVDLGGLVESSHPVEGLGSDALRDTGETLNSLLGVDRSVVKLHDGVEVSGLGVGLLLDLLVVTLVGLQEGVLSSELLVFL